MKEETVEESMRFISVFDADGKEIDLDLIEPRKKKKLGANVFCPTGEGGGKDPTCKGGREGSSKPIRRKRLVADLARKLRVSGLTSKDKLSIALDELLSEHSHLGDSYDHWTKESSEGRKRFNRDLRKEMKDREI